MSRGAFTTTQLPSTTTMTPLASTTSLAPDRLPVRAFSAEVPPVKERIQALVDESKVRQCLGVMCSVLTEIVDPSSTLALSQP